MRKKFSVRFLKTFVYVGAVAAALAAPKSAVADNLSDAMIGAYKTSGLLEQNRALLRATDESVAVAVARLRPIVDFAMTASHRYSRGISTFGFRDHDTNGLDVGVSMEWLLYDGGASRLGQLAAQETVLATRQSLLDIEQQVLFSAVQAYVNVLLQQDTVRLRGNNLRLLREELRAAQDRFEVGEVTRTDVALAESRVAAAQASLTESQGDLLEAKATYIEVVGNPINVVAGQPPLPQRVASLQAAESVAMRNHPSLLARQHSVKAAQHTAASTEKNLGPSVRLRADAGHTYDLNGNGDSDTSGVSLTLSQRLYAGGGLAAARRADIARLDAEKGALISTQRSVTQSVAAAYVSLEAARASLVSSVERVRAAQVAFEGIREEATLGARTTLDVLQAEQELLGAQTARVQARANQALAAYQLLQAQGLLTAEHLGLAVEIYDPTLYYNLVKDAPAHISKRSKDLDRVLKALGRD
ncbi:MULTISPECIES: TolC family outer membrane protein [Rhodobacterales]|jgi:outer membrane protein|uniref:TolC family outer membrane protein n=1 Tax=Rhodobacterales TaxID=204455 RepID=UPI00237F7857|nr:TolC family outer membrane protein [Phaeobacter gallaeciensis]MDE4099181.1 TolC family outer membrane protein [Phaeobacter gallaeciensis]MDE4107953.1 TolC family outer membrane protein [Phaeobacter gallaeciensis]MDE4112445.1 TolC family outer membrane protein [Phaeobacter gallaeciensis]MDE4116878.1 TolC family outer membrane protein [Phaeobacter gallaeciensis]MDE4121388.1 TolC family outer membrane protein [Phaeobacter gallaeciensis]